MIEGSAVSIPSERRGLRQWSRTYRVLGTLVDWARALSEGHAADLKALCRAHQITYRVLLNELKANPKIQEEVFGSLAVEGKLVLVQSVKTAAEILSNPEASADQKLKWSRFIAQWVGGAFEKRSAPQVAIVNLIPDRPPELVKTVPATELPRSLEDLT